MLDYQERNQKMKTLLNNENRIFTLARQGKRLPNIAVSIFIPIIIFIAAILVTGICGDILFGDIENLPPIWKENFLNVVPFTLVILFLWMWIALFEKRPFWTIGLVKEKAILRYITGFLIGGGMIAFAIGLLAITGNIIIEQDGLQSSGVSVLASILVFLVGFIVQGASEEMLFRGWQFPVIGARYKPWIGILVSSIIFALLHGVSSGINIVIVINIILFSVFLSLYYLLEGSIWGVCGWHAAWNWIPSNIFGLEVTGITAFTKPVFDLKVTGSHILSGGKFGPEGGMLATIVLVTGIVIIVFLANRKNQRLNK